ncbi:HD-GYP domain-containing protein [Pseudomonas borbori]
MLKRIAVTDVRVGMFIQEFCGAWMDHPFWRSKFPLQSDKDLQRILASGIRELWIDTSRGLDVEVGTVSASPEEVDAQVTERLLAVDSAPVVQTCSLDEEISRAAKLCARSKQAVVDMFSDARLGKALDFEQAQELVGEISTSLMRHPNALISLARLKNADEYTYMHSVAVCALMIALARQLGLAEEQVREAGMAGMLHDIGKMAVPLALLNKPGKLTDDEFDTMRKHPAEGSRIIRMGKHFSALVLDVCLHHHEKMDGSGYPHKLVGEQISLFARMGAVCDVYDAVTSDRAYKKGWSPAESIHKMAGWKGHFDDKVFHAFVKTIGIYPTGSLVRLASDRIAVVLDQSAASLLTPKVKVFYSVKTRSAIMPQVVDLAELAGRDKIVSREAASDWGLRNTDELWTGLS